MKRVILAISLVMGVLYSTSITAASWEVNPYDYQYDMSVYISPKVGSGVSSYEGFSFGAFVGDECRGVGEFIQDDRLSSPVLYMRVYSNASSGETVTFKASDSSLGGTYPSETTIDFKNEEMTGSPAAPYEMDFFVAVTSVTISNQSLEIIMPETATLIATVSPSFASDKTLVWSSSNEKVATVNAQGIVTPVADGEATIKATSSNGVSASCVVIVTDYSGVEGLSSDYESCSVYSAKGQLLKEKADTGYIQSLSKGIYILKSGNNVTKLIK